MNNTNCEFEYDQIEDAFLKIKHRGPDNQCLLKLDNEYLGHTRLSIVDTQKRSNQPFRFSDVICTFNGEIYNYIHLRKFLIDEFNAKFLTEGDTEVLIQGLFYMGTEFISLIDGMYAFIYRDKNKIIVARDLYGQKPLFYCQNGKALLAIASELQVLSCLISDKSICFDGLKDVLRCGATVAPNTCYNSIKQLLPGEVRTYESGELVFSSNLNNCAKKVIPKQIENVFDVNVPSVFFVSCGVDSTFLLNWTNKFNLEQLRFLALKTPSDQNFEALAKKVEDKFKIQVQIKEFDAKNNDLPFMLSETLRIQGEPFGDSSFINSVALFSNVEQEFKVCFGGDGADELQLGYKPSIIIAITAIVTSIFFLRLRKNIIKFLVTDSYKNLLLRAILGSINDLNIFLSGYKSISSYNKLGLDGTGEEILSSKSDTVAFYKTFLMRRMSNVFLRKLDRASMIFSKEARSPFLHNDSLEISNPSLFQLAIPKINLKLSLISKMGIFFVFRKKIGFELKSDNLRDSLETYCYNHRKSLSILGLNLDAANLADYRTNNLFRIASVIHFLRKLEDAK